MATAFQPSGFQNPDTYDHFGFQVTPPSTTQSVVSALTIDQTMQMASDQWELALNSSDLWRARARAGTVDLSLGLIDALNNDQLVKHIQDGKVDEWELQMDPQRLIGRMRGRDAMAYALDSALSITYVSGGIAPPTPDQSTLPPGLQAIPGVTQQIFLAGTWSAAGIISDLASRVGLTLSYEAPNYILHKDVVVNGPVLGAIQQIIAPFNNFEPFKVDVWVEGKVLMVRQRSGLFEKPSPGGPVPGPLNTISVHDARITTLKIRSHFLDFIRIFKMIGIVKEQCSALDATADSSEEYHMPDGKTTEVKRHYRITDDATLTTEISVSSLTQGLISRESTVSDWESLVFDSNCNLQYTPKQFGKITTYEDRSPDDGVLRVVKRIELTYKYDANGFMSEQGTLESQAENAPGETLKPRKRELQAYIPNGVKTWVNQVTRWTIDDEGHETVADSGTTPGSGQRPGGPGRGIKTAYTTTTPSRAFKNAIIDDVPGAKDISIQADLDEGAIGTIFSQAVQSSGAQEYEIQFTAANIPWAKKGMMLKLTGLEYEDGSALDLPQFLVLDNRVIYIEDSMTPTSLTQIKGCFWSKTF